MTSISSRASVIIGLGDCRLVLDHTARSDVNFKADVDVRGNKVIGADYGIGPKIKLQDKMTFKIVTDIANKYNLSEKDLIAQMSVVSVSIKNGRVFLNDHLIMKKDQANLEARCRSLIDLE
jgi:hypothetical protein